MKQNKYLIDNLPQIIITIIGYIITILNVFKTDKNLKIALTIVYVIVMLIIYVIDCFRKYNFYKQLTNILNDKKYLILEMIKNAALKNKDDILENNVNLEVDIHNGKVLIDSKSLELILNKL